MSQNSIDELKALCAENGISEELVNELIDAEKNALTKDRRISHKETLKDIISKYI